MRAERMPIHELFAQFLTTGHGGVSVKRAFPARHLHDGAPGRCVMSLLKVPSEKPSSDPTNSRDA